MGSPFDDVGGVQVGDTIKFSWTEGFNHNVVIHPSGTCDVTDSIFIGGGTTPAIVEYVVPEEYNNTILTFACQVDEHCKFQNLVFFLYPMSGFSTRLT